MFARDATYPSRPREFITYDEGDPRAYGPDGVVRDGVRLRCKMMTMDSARLPFAAAPRNIRTGLTGEHALSKFFYPDGSPKPRRRKTQERDKFGREMAEYIEEDAVTHDAYSDNKPGFRTSVTAADNARVVDAYNQMVHDTCVAWMTPEQRAQHGVVDVQQTHDTQERRTDVGTVEARDAAYAEMVHDLENQWRPKDAAAAQVKPVGAWGLDIGLKAGDTCAFEGGIGRLVRKGDWLFCELDPAPTPRVPSSNPSTDSVRTMDAATAQRIKDEAYNEMCAELRDAWKPKV